MTRSHLQAGPATDHYHNALGPDQTAAGASVNVDNGVDPPAAVTTLVALGAVIAGDSATLGAGVPDSWVFDEDGVLTVSDDLGTLTIDSGSLKFALGNNTTLTINRLGWMKLWDISGSLLLEMDEFGNFGICGPAGTYAFRVYGDGSVHIKTGTSIVADL